MGFLDGMKQRKIAKKFAADTKAYENEYAMWSTNNAAIDEMIENVDACIAGNIDTVFTDRSDYGFMLKSGEIPVALVQGAGYIELVKAPTRYSGGYGGVSFPVFGRVRINTGRTGGQVIPGAESLNMTDKGVVMISTKRVMFQGSIRNHEWRFEKMMSMAHLPGGITTFAMSTAGKPAGLGYGDDTATLVQFRLEIAAAIALGTLDQFRGELQVEKDKHVAEMPVPPAPLVLTS